MPTQSGEEQGAAPGGDLVEETPLVEATEEGAEEPPAMTPIAVTEGRILIYINAANEMYET